MAIDSDEVRSRADELLDAGARDPLDTMRHSAAHVMASAVMQLFPEARLGIGPAIKDGFYYDFELPRPLTPADLEAIEAKMREQVAADVPFERSELSRDEALAELEHSGQPFKVEIVREPPAAPFWHPRGMALWRALEAWSLEVRRDGGFAEVRTPSLVRRELWQQSGHWDLYQDNMFVLDADEHVAGLKPMNCPEEILVYKTRSRSYRDLPMRFADYSTLFRQERTGALAGLFRVRPLTRDDSHVFCREDQVADELRLALNLVQRQFAPFGFTPTFKLATRPEKKLGSDEFWDMAEGRLREALDAEQLAYQLDPGGAAFYAPKIDVFIEDALGREWQMATIQLDYQLPQRFDLEYRSGEGHFERPVMIHYAIYGTFERFTGIIVEHFAGAFPLWLAPVQVMVVPIADRHLEYATEVREALAAARIRAEIDDRSERMQAKLRDAQEQQIPVMLVVGDRDQEARAVSPRLRTGASTQGIPLDDFVQELRTRIEERQLWPRSETSSDDSSGDGAKPSRQREASATAS